MGSGLRKTVRLAATLVVVAGCSAPTEGPNAPSASSSSPDNPDAGPDGPGRVTGGGGPGTGYDGPPREQTIEGQRFTDVTLQAGLSGAPHGFVSGYTATGQAFGDFDGDGDHDLYVTDALAANTLYRNHGDGTFEVAAESEQVALPRHTSGGALFFDFDNDGDQDLYVLGKGANVLFENDRGRFVDVTARAGLGDPGMGQTASAADYDGDGWLDLYVANWFCEGCGLEEGWATRADRLFHNQGDGTFADVTIPLLGKPHTDGFGFVAGWTDIDADGDLDLYVVNDKGYPGPPRNNAAINRNVLFRNDGAGCEGWCFTEVAESMGADGRVDGMGLAIGDYDGDLDLDLFYTHLRRPELRRRTETGYEEVGAQAGLTRTVETWGAAFFDHDNDGDLDLYVAAGEFFGPDNPNPFYDNLGDGTFADLTEITGAPQPRYSMGLARADVDGDGWVDLLVGNYATGYRLLRNNGAARHDHHWLTIRLTGGGRINADAIGARVWVEADDGRRQVRELRAGESHGAGHAHDLHFGLGEARASAVEVRWPDGRTDRFEDAPTDAVWLLAYPQ